MDVDSWANDEHDISVNVSLFICIDAQWMPETKTKINSLNNSQNTIGFYRFAIEFHLQWHVTPEIVRREPFTLITRRSEMQPNLGMERITVALAKILWRVSIVVRWPCSHAVIPLLREFDFIYILSIDFDDVFLVHSTNRKDGFLYDKQAILQYIITKKTEYAKKLKEYERQRQIDDNQTAENNALEEHKKLLKFINTEKNIITTTTIGSKISELASWCAVLVMGETINIQIHL